MGGKVVATDIVRTHGRSHRLVLRVDDTELIDDGADMTRVVATALDEQGTPVPTEDSRIIIEVRNGNFIGESPIHLGALAHRLLRPDAQGINLAHHHARHRRRLGTVSNLGGEGPVTEEFPRLLKRFRRRWPGDLPLIGIFRRERRGLAQTPAVWALRIPVFLQGLLNVRLFTLNLCHLPLAF